MKGLVVKRQKWQLLGHSVVVRDPPLAHLFSFWEFPPYRFLSIFTPMDDTKPRKVNGFFNDLSNFWIWVNSQVSSTCYVLQVKFTPKAQPRKKRQSTAQKPYLHRNLEQFPSFSLSANDSPFLEVVTIFILFLPQWGGGWRGCATTPLLQCNLLSLPRHLLPLLRNFLKIK